MRKKMLKNIEWGILICILVLLTIGLVALFSATQNSNYEEFKKQIMWVVISIPVMIAIMYIDYCAENPDFQIDLETFWKDLMRQAMEAQDVQDMFRICSLIMNE